jgi:trigger factor
MSESTATTENPDETSTDVKIENVGPALKRLTITIPPAAVSEKLEESIGTLLHEATLPGFRRGKAPRKLLERKFGTSVRSETKNQLIADAYAKAVEAHDIHPVGEPEPTEPTDKLELVAGKPLSFSVEVEVAPEFELPELEGIPIRKPLLEITDEHIQDRIQRQQVRLGESTPIEGEFQAGDRVLGQVTLAKQGEDEPLFDNEQAIIVCPGTEDNGKGPVLGLMIDGLAGMLKGRAVGDTLTIEAVGPEGHERQDIRGANLTITFRILQAERPVPATIENLLEIFSVETEDILREQMRMALQHQCDQEQSTAMREQVYKHLLDTVEMELPERLSAGQAARALEGHRLELLERGLAPDEVERQLAEMRGDSETQARDRLKLFFLLRRLGEHFKVDVSEQEINGRIATIAAQHGQRPDQLRAELSRTGKINEVARMVYEQKAADRVIAKAAIEEIPAEKWNEITEAESGASTTTRTSKKTTTKKKTKKKTTKKTGG